MVFVPILVCLRVPKQDLVSELAFAPIKISNLGILAKSALPYTWDSRGSTGSMHALEVRLHEDLLDVTKLDVYREANQ